MGLGASDYLLYEDNINSFFTLRYYVIMIYDASTIDASDYQHNGNTISFYVQSSSEEMESVVLPILCYDNYHAYDENGTELEISKDEHNRISVAVPAGYTGQISVIYRYPFIWKVAIFVSATTIILMVGYGIYNARRKKSLADEEETVMRN